ncbi:unnamed protein product [Allacma fusca]|uniref:Uncharacterized protein n=1 Tax=Allacma fusca TaxID=39272 RepID=A0A8J2NYB9_9HEXA|nr:unnamed protein product [Allacma fusca]
MDHTRPRFRIIRLQPSLAFMSQMHYVITSGNEDEMFEISSETPASLHFKRKIRTPRTYDLEIVGYSWNRDVYRRSKKDPFTLRLRLIVTN